MNAARLIASAMRRVPSSLKSTITFTAPDSSTIVGTVVGIPASGSPADGFEASTAIREHSRTLSVQLGSVTELLTSSMTAEWEGAKWQLGGVSPVPPGATATGLWRVVMSR